MTKISWKEAAKQSEDTEVKKLLEEYKISTKKDKTEIRDRIIEILQSKKQETEEEIKTEVEEPKVEVEEDEEIVKETEEEKRKRLKIEKMRELRDEVYKLEHSRLKYATYEENMELNKKIKKVNKEIVRIRTELREERMKEKAEKMKKDGQVSSIRLKQSRILKLLRIGVSFTNITKHPEGVKKEEIVKVVENNQEFMEEMRKIRANLPQMWFSWKKKFIK